MHAGKLLPGNTSLVLKFSHALCICSRTQSRKQNTDTHANSLAISTRVFFILCLCLSREVEIVENNFYDRQKVYHLPRYTLLFLCGCVYVCVTVFRCEYMCDCKFTPDSVCSACSSSTAAK